jgi:hypothetical protein
MGDPPSASTCTVKLYVGALRGEMISAESGEIDAKIATNNAPEVL